MKYVILVGCDNPVHANMLSHANGTTQVFSVKSDADEVLEKIKAARGENHARIVAL